jgi:hypothetical protein
LKIPGASIGCGIDDASDGAVRTELPALPRAGIDTVQNRILVGAATPVEIPIGNAFHGSNDPRAWPEQRPHLVKHEGNRMCFKADDDEILRPELDGVVGAARLHHVGFLAEQ